jgi:hypothetical protein
MDPVALEKFLIRMEHGSVGIVQATPFNPAFSRCLFSKPEGMPCYESQISQGPSSLTFSGH